MKKYLILISAIITAVSAVSCNTKKNTADFVVDENFTVYTDTTYAQVAADNLDAEINSEKPGKLSYALNGSKVELLLDNVLVKVLQFYYTPSPDYFSVDDFNFDGYEDIFVPFESPPDYGTYFCYNPEKKDFEENKELNNIGRFMKITADGTLSEDRSDSTVQRFVEYQWSDGILKKVKRTESYKSAETGEIITNVYGYDPKGNEFLSG